MQLKSLTLHRIKLQLITPFVTSNGAYNDRETIIVEAVDELGNVGFGECVAFATPWYTEETVDGAWQMLQQYLIPAVIGKSFDHPSHLPSYWQHIKRHHMAKASIEMAIWDLHAKREAAPLYKLIGGTQDELKVGVAIGIQQTYEHYNRLIDQYLREGYERIKIKIKPGNDIDLVHYIRQHYPNVPLMVDANSAYTLADIEHLQQLDPYKLLMIEQPLAADDIVDHAALQQKMKTAICLDESILSAADVRKAIQLGSTRVINVKLGRVGGWNEALKIHQYCAQHHIPLWCGGMLETGIGRAHNMALATLPQFTLPGDISASSRYWERDIITPEITIHNGKIKLPNSPGIGVELDRSFLEQVKIEHYTVASS